MHACSVYYITRSILCFGWFVHVRVGKGEIGKELWVYGIHHLFVHLGEDGRGASELFIKVGSHFVTLLQSSNTSNITRAFSNPSF